MTILVGWSFEAFDVEAGQLVVFGGIADLDRVAADFTIFDVDLTGNGKIQDHGDLFAAVRAHEMVFHRLHRGSKTGLQRIVGYFNLILKEPSGALSRCAMWQFPQLAWAVFSAAAASSNFF